MEKMKFETLNLTAENVTKIAELFPGVVTEGKVNFELLRSMLGDDVYGNEAYEFTWVGKRAAIAEAGRPIRKTLRPCVEESKDWDTTENLYIEGDNLDVLKLLQESYLGKVKMIYIDPPYNTGKNLIYKNNFYQSDEDYMESSGAIDSMANRLVVNTKSNGRFHSDWCSMIYSRLLLARNLLARNGIIVLTIDDNEIENVTSMMNEVFGEENHLGTVIVKNNPQGRSSVTGFQISHEYALFYSCSSEAQLGRLPRNDDQLSRYGEQDSKGQFEWRNFRAQYSTESPKMVYPIYVKKDASDFRIPKLRWNEKERGYDILEKEVADELVSLPIDASGRTRTWKWSIETVLKEKETEMGVRIDRSGVPAVYYKGRMKEQDMLPYTIWDKPEYSSSTFGANLLAEMFEGKIFSYPKSLYAVIDSLKTGNANEDALVLDFFSGSATTAHAVMQLNAEDGGKRKFIMVQLPESVDSVDFPTICEIGKERIRRAGEKIKDELTAKNAKDTKENQESFSRVSRLDTGFRVLKLDDTNMNDVYYAAGEYTQELLLRLESNIKSDRTDMDLLYGCLLDWGLPLSMPHTHEKIDGFTVHTYNDGDLIACFEESISEKVIREIANRKPLRAVFRDSSFNSSPEKINVFEIFKLLAPGTSVKVI